MTEKEKIREYLAEYADDVMCDYATSRDIKGVILPFIDSMPKDDKSETVDYIRLLLEDIGNTANRTTAGNVAHNIPSIKYRAEQALKSLNELQKPTTSVWHNASERPKQKKEIVFQWQSVDSDKKWLDVGVYHKRGDYMKTIGKDGEDTIEMKYVIRWANPIDLLKL